MIGRFPMHATACHSWLLGSALALSMALGTAWLGADEAAHAQAPARVDFASQIEPILAKHCYECHGEKKARGKLRLHIRDLALKGGATGALLVPGDRAKSYIVHRLPGEGGAHPTQRAEGPPD